MIPDVFVYTGVATFVVGWAVWFQGAHTLALLLMGTSTASFATRILLDRRSQREAVA